MFDISYNLQLLGLPTSPGWFQEGYDAQANQRAIPEIAGLKGGDVEFLKVWEKPRNKDWSNCYIIGVN